MTSPDVPMPQGALDASDVAAPSEAPPLTGAAARRPSARYRFVVAFLITLLVGLSSGVGALYAYETAYDGRIVPGVWVGDVDLSGMDHTAAEARLAAAYAPWSEGELVLAAPGDERAIPYRDFGRRVDAAGLVRQALAVGHDGTIIDRALVGARTAVSGVALKPRVTFDADLLAGIIRREVGGYGRPAVSAGVLRTEAGFVVSPGRTGVTVDAEALVDEAIARLGDPAAPARVRLVVTLSAVSPPVTDSQAQLARIAGEQMARDVTLRDGEDSWTIGADTVRSWISFSARSDGVLAASFDRAGMAAALGGIVEQVARPAKDAAFLTGSGGEIVGVTPGREGRALNVGATVERIVGFLGARATGQPRADVQPALARVVPDFSTQDAEQTAPLMKAVSSWTTWFPYGIKNNYGANIWLPAKFINGTVVRPGGTFDFWDAVGPVTSERGFGLGGAIINGRTEPQGALAGGICSTSTTLFNAALRAGLQMGARKNHYYYIDRYPLGLDATVFISSSTSRQSMSFTNDTPYPILIRGSGWRVGSKGYVRFTLYTVPLNREVSFSTPIVKNVRPATTITEYTTDLRPGKRDQIEYEVDGKDVWVTRTVTDRATGQVLHEETYYSHYARITGIILVGKAPEPPVAEPSPAP